MRIGLVDIDGHAKKKKWGATVYPNLALCKIARWHRQQGAEVVGDGTKKSPFKAKWRNDYYKD